MSQCQITVRVTPRSGRDEVSGWQDGELRVRLRAPPLQGRANQSLCRVLAQQLGLPPAAVEVIGGAASRRKRLRIQGLTEDEVRSRTP